MKPKSKVYYKNKTITKLAIIWTAAAFIALVLKNNSIRNFHLMGIFEAFLIFTALLGFFLFVRIVRVKSELIYFSPFPHRTHISNIKKVNAYGELALSRLTNEIDQLDIFHDDDKGKIRINGWLFEPETLGELITDLKKENSQIILDSGALLLLDLYKQKHSQ